MKSFFALMTVLLMLVMQASAAPAKNEQEKRGVLLLDSISFPKIVPNPNHDVIVMLSQKKEFGEYGTDSMRTDYFNFAFRAQTQDQAADHVIFAQVIVNGAENRQLATSIGAREDFKYPLLFIFPAGSKTAIQYPENEPFHINTITQFAARHSTLQFQLPGTMKKFDQIVTEFMRTDAKHQALLIAQAERELEELVDEGEIESASYYLKLMRRVEEHGFEFIEKEIKRQTRIMNDDTKVSKAKKRLVQYHLNVLHHFKASIPSMPINDEF